MKDFIRLAGTLCAITFIAAALLGGVNALTEERIAAAKEEERQNAMRALIPSAEGFDTFNGNEDIFVGFDKSNDIAGFCVNAVSSGYGGEIEMMVGVDKNFKISGVEILSNSETAGLGANCTREDVKSQFAGLTAPITVIKGGAANGEDQINALTGATITSKAVAAGVNDAYAKLNDAVLEAAIEGGEKE